MPAATAKMTTLALALAGVLLAGGSVVHAQDGGVEVFPRLIVQDAERPNAPWPSAREPVVGTWIPVFMLGDGDGRMSLDPLNPDPVGGVLVGVAQVQRGHSGHDLSHSLSPSLSWRIGEDLRVGAAMTVTEFIPCRSLLQAPLAPLRTHQACESYAGRESAPDRAVEIHGGVEFGSARLSIGFAETPAIYILPGGIGMDGVAGSRGSPAVAALPMAPIAGLGQETAQTLSLGGSLAFGEQSQIDVTLALSQFPRIENSPDLGRMQVRYAYGSFSADLATQMIRQGLESVSPWWAGLDLGLSWRTPWSGIISVGARNLVSSGEPPRIHDGRSKEASDSDFFSRTPYVRYEQDF